MADLQFRVSSGLKNIIGRDLITDDYVAVFELVKNSYDAHASHVLVEFQEDRIVIEDNGKGMSLEDIRNKWLFVAYSAKKEGLEDVAEGNNNEDDYRNKITAKRYYAGAKGIGRFSCDRLGNKLVLITQKEGTDKTEKLVVNWDEFDQDAKKEFINIKVKHETINRGTIFFNKSEHGTKLEIRQLNESWDRKKKQGLKKSLEKLINPFEGDLAKDIENAHQSFSIFIKDDTEAKNDENEKNERDRVNGEVKNFVFEKLNLKTSQIITSIDENGSHLTMTLIDRGKLVYKIRRPNQTIPKLKNIRFHLFYLNKAAKHNFTSTIGVQPKDFGSIFIYKNGFRIAPYGDAGDDSFGIDNRHAQNVFRTFGLRDIIGRIEIFGENVHFRETSSRNGGLIKNDHFDVLKKCFEDFCLKKLEDYMIDVAWHIKEDKEKDDTSLLENIKSKNEMFKLIRREVTKGEGELEEIDKSFIAIKANSLQEATKEAIDNLKFIANQYGDNSFIEFTTRTEGEFIKMQREKEELTKKLAAEEEEKRKAEEEKKRLEEQLKLEQEKNTYLLATRRTLSKDAEGLIHNIKSTTNKIRSNVDTLIEKISTGQPSEKEILRYLGIIRIWSDKALKISELITRANFKTKADKQVIDVVKFIEQYFSLFNDIYEKDQLAFDVLTNNAHLERRLSILDVSLVLDNFIFNAEKAGASNISVHCQNTNPNMLTITISDDGKGVDEQFLPNPDKMFELGVTTTDGSGIGLFAIKENLRLLNAKVRFVGNNIILKGATFEITFQ